MSKPKFSETTEIKPKFSETRDIPVAPEEDDEGLIMKGLKGAETAGHYASKGLDYLRGSITAPLLAAGLEATSGRDVYNFDEHLQALNPLSDETFPTSAELMDRAGVPEGSKMSDIMGAYAEPWEDSPWYQPKKGGMLDISMRGAGGFGMDSAIDPLTYISMGSHLLAKQGLRKSASRRAFEAVKPKPSMAKSLATSAVKKATNLQFMPLLSPLTSAALLDELGKKGQILKNIATFPSDAINRIGDHLYSSVLQPLEHEGQLFKKRDIGQTLYNAGIKTPFGLRDKVDKATDVLMRARDNLLHKADKHGAKVDMRKALLPARMEIQKLRQIGNNAADNLADDLEKEVNDLIKRHEGVPGTPDTVYQQRTQVGQSQYGVPKMGYKTVTKKGTPGVKPQPYTATKGTKLKSFLYDNLPNSTFHQNLRTGPGAKVQSKLSLGMKEGVEDAVADTLGRQAGADLAELNEEAGKLLATKRSQTRVSNQQERNLSNIQNVTGTDSAVAALGSAHNNMEGGAKAIAMKKLIDGLRLMTMPGGYALKKLSESPTLAPLTDAYIRGKLKQKLGKDNYGEEENEEE